MRDSEIEEWLTEDWKRRTAARDLPDLVRRIEGSGPWKHGSTRPGTGMSLTLRLAILLAAFLVATYLASLIVHAGRLVTDFQIAPDPAHFCGRC